MDSFDHIQKQILWNLIRGVSSLRIQKKWILPAVTQKKMDLSWNVHDIQNLPRCALFPPLWSMEDMNEVDEGEIIFKQQIVVNF